MISGLDPGLSGWLVVGVMLTSGLVLGIVSDRVLRLVGVRDRVEKP
ncbi:MAG: hypothetical protein HYX78_12450 [Armatimonadetes bacterium]|nr:hypothetical protein [Armatimonadota bacterium]